MQLVSKISNLCDPDPDRWTSCNRNTALCTKVHRTVKIIQHLKCDYSVMPENYLCQILYVCLVVFRPLFCRFLYEITCMKLTLCQTLSSDFAITHSYLLCDVKLQTINNNLLSVPWVHSAQHLPPTVSASIPPQSGSHSRLAFVLLLVHHHTHSVVCLKPTVSSRPSVPASSSHKCLRFGFWLTLRNIHDSIYLLTYRTYLSTT